MDQQPDITVGFMSGAEFLLEHFTGQFSSATQFAEMNLAYKASSATCSGHIGRRESRTPSVVVHGAHVEHLNPEDVGILISAQEIREVEHASIRVGKHDDGTPIVTITHGPRMSDRAWRIVYGSLLHEIWKAGRLQRLLAEGKSPHSERSAAEEVAGAWH